MIDKVAIYNDCFNKKYHNEKLEPVIRELYLIIRHYNKEILGPRKPFTTPDFERENLNKKDCINKLFSLFEKIVDNGEYDDMYHTIELLFSLKLNYDDFLNYLALFYLKEDTYNYNMMDFYRKIEKLSYLIRRYNTFETSNTYLFKLLNCYLSKYQELSTLEIPYYLKLRFFLDEYGFVFVSVIYLKYELNDLERIFDGIINNFEEIENYFLLNGINSIFKDIELNDRLDFVMNIINNKRKLKVIE